MPQLCCQGLSGSDNHAERNIIARLHTVPMATIGPFVTALNAGFMNDQRPKPQKRPVFRLVGAVRNFGRLPEVLFNSRYQCFDDFADYGP